VLKLALPAPTLAIIKWR